MGLFDNTFEYDPALIDVPPGTPMETPTPATQPADPAKKSVDWTKALLGIGDLLGGMGHAVSGGKTPNAASAIGKQVRDTIQDDVNTKIKTRQLQLQEEKASDDRLKTGWELIKDVRELIDPTDDDAVDKAAAMISGKMGDPAWKDLVKRSVSDKGFGDTVERMYPQVVAKVGRAEAMKMFRKPAFHDELKKSEASLAGEDAFNAVNAALDQGLINPDISMADLIKVMPKAKNLTDDHKAQLFDKGFKGIKTKSMIENEAKGAIETESHRQAEARQNKTLDAQEQRHREDMAVSERRHQEVMALAAKREARLDEQQRRILPSQQKSLTSNRTAVRLIDDYTKAFNEYIKEVPEGTALDDTFRGILASNAKAQKVRDIVVPTGRTPAERKMAAMYKAAVGSLKSLTDEVGVMTDDDAVRILGSFDITGERKQVLANLSERRKSHQRSYDMLVEDLMTIGKEVKGFEGRAAPGAGRVAVIGPDGKSGTIPAADLEQALKAGYKKK
jgi:hypothetical protein